MSLKRLMEENPGLINVEIARISGMSETTVSQIRNNKYAAGNREQKEAEILAKLAAAGYRMKNSKITVRSDVFVMTSNWKKFEAMCDELLDPQIDITSSIGVVIGIAGRGKSRAAKRYASLHREVAYILNIEGYSLVDLMREVAFELSGLRPHSFRSCLDAIENSTVERDEHGHITKSRRRLIMIDEADLMPKRYVESLRNINEYCSCPIVLVGEEGLKNTLEAERRLQSRVRQQVIFEPIGLADLVAYYQMALNIELDLERVAPALHKRSRGDFRLVVKDAIAASRIMNNSDMQSLSMPVVDAL